MYLKTNFNVGDGLYAPPPISTSLDEWKKISSECLKAPFRVGDVVIPKFVPIDEKGKRRNRCQIVTLEDRLTVRSITGRGENYTVSFEGNDGSYDASFFKKCES